MLVEIDVTAVVPRDATDLRTRELSPMHHRFERIECLLYYRKGAGGGLTTHDQLNVSMFATGLARQAEKSFARPYYLLFNSPQLKESCKISPKHVQRAFAHSSYG
jgi:hypothetical protein